MKGVVNILILAVILTGCSKDNSVGIKGCTYAYPDSSAFHPRQDSYHDLLAKYRIRGFPGLVIAISDSMHGLWLGASGYASVEAQETLQICHLHHSASVSKMYISATLLKLYELGAIDLYSNAKHHLPSDIPDLPNLNSVKVIHLLNHSSGIPGFDEDPMYYVRSFNDPFRNTSWRHQLEGYVSGKKALFAPGSEHRYSNTNFLLLGLIIEQVSGQSLGDAVQNLLLSPAGLTETYYKASPGYPDMEGVTENYFFHYDRYIQNCTKMQQHFADISMGHEGIIASPRDYVLFLATLMGGKLLQPSTLQKMMDFQEGPEEDVEYGLGIFQVKTNEGTIIGHSGNGFGTMTYLFYIPETRTTVFYASNLGNIFENDLRPVFYDDLLNEIIHAVNEIP